MKIGDTVRVIHPTGGIMKHHRFRVEEVPEDPNGWIVIKGDVGGRHGVRTMRFHRLSLEVVDAPNVEASAIHPATQKRARVEADLKARIEDYAQAVKLRARGKADKDYVDRARDEMLQAIPFLCEACYAEVDDGHGLGKEGLDAARDLVDDAVWYPLNRLSAGDRQDDAWLVSDEKMQDLKRVVEGG